MLASLEEAGEWVEKRWGLSLELEDLPLDDPQVYKLLRSSHTVGVFQLESPGMRELLSRLKPTCFSDVVANLSLFRPGPVQADMVSPFVRRRQGKERVTYLDPKLKAILEETYGVPLFQEQIMRILSHFGGVSLAQADSWRRALDRNQPQEIKRVRREFLKAAQRKGYPQPKAGRIFDELVLVMAAYGFCKSHAASFAEIAYRS
ncbi:DNA polymerase III subunit alpha, partial [Candidatus Hakubella thermalkaliphila]